MAVGGVQGAFVSAGNSLISRESTGKIAQSGLSHAESPRKRELYATNRESTGTLDRLARRDRVAIRPASDQEH